MWLQLPLSLFVLWPSEAPLFQFPSSSCGSRFRFGSATTLSLPILIHPTDRSSVLQGQGQGQGQQLPLGSQHCSSIPLTWLHGFLLFLVVHGQCGFPVTHCLTGFDLSAHLFHFGLQVSVLPEGHLGEEPSAQGVLGFTPPGQIFSSLPHWLNLRSATVIAERVASVSMINLMLITDVAEASHLHKGS